MSARQQTVYRGEIVQIINPEHAWYPALMVVHKVTPHRLMVYAFVPGLDKAKEWCPAFLFVPPDDITVVGHAHIVVGDENEEDDS